MLEKHGREGCKRGVLYLPWRIKKLDKRLARGRIRGVRVEEEEGNYEEQERRWSKGTKGGGMRKTKEAHGRGLNT